LSQSISKPSWHSHDFKVKMLDWSSARGSRLRYTCRLCSRKFCHFTVQSQGPWAVDGESRALESAVSDRWLAEACPRGLLATDEADRMRLREPLH
jgi:hypothetical protein